MRWGVGKGRTSAGASPGPKGQQKDGGKTGGCIDDNHEVTGPTIADAQATYELVYNPVVVVRGS
jgi:hypothetical protein